MAAKVTFCINPTFCLQIIILTVYFLPYIILWVHHHTIIIILYQCDMKTFTQSLMLNGGIRKCPHYLNYDIVSIGPHRVLFVFPFFVNLQEMDTVSGACLLENTWFSVIFRELSFHPFLLWSGTILLSWWADYSMAIKTPKSAWDGLKYF